jgi:hypothetical protein
MIPGLSTVAAVVAMEKNYYNMVPILFSPELLTVVLTLSRCRISLCPR